MDPVIKSHVLYRLSYGLERVDNALLMWGSPALRKPPGAKIKLGQPLIPKTAFEGKVVKLPGSPPQPPVLRS